MSDEDPFAPRPKPPVSFETLSVHELEAKIEALKADIGECERMIALKKRHLSAADAVFGAKRS
ncbi:MAG TPA: DUF1192 domain-containing protein [Caulobacterales bacterium]|nr:DUF1192 domain-containing protein [Caulobacterales bacterium]